MRIGIIGAGHIGGTLAQLFVRVGHQLAIANSRGPDTLEELVAELGERAQATTADGRRPVRRAGRRLGALRSLPRARARRLRRQGRHRHQQLLPPTRRALRGTRQRPHHLSELLQQHLPDARVVKAFNAIYWEHLRDYGRPAGDPARIGIPISGDDEHAKRTVAELIDQIGFDAVDAGTLAEGGRKHQPGSPVYAADLPTGELRATPRSLSQRIVVTGERPSPAVDRRRDTQPVPRLATVSRSLPADHASGRNRFALVRTLTSKS